MKTFKESLKELEVVADGFWGKLDKLSKDIISVEDTLRDLHIEFEGNPFLIEDEFYKFVWGKNETGKFRLLLVGERVQGDAFVKAFCECKAKIRMAAYPNLQPFIEQITNHIKTFEE